MDYEYNDDLTIAPLTAEMCQHFNIPEYLISDVLEHGEISCVFGAPSAGKSLISLYVAYMISKGDPISGIKTEKRPVLYLAYEDFAGTVRRVAGLYSHHGPTDTFFVHGGFGNLYEEDDDGNSFAINRAVKYVRENRICLVIIDTLTVAFYGVNENDNNSMNRVVERVKYLANKTGAAIILVHHNTKSDGSTPRGHGVLLGALDMAMQIRQPSPGNIEARFTKIRNSSIGAALSFQIHVESIGVNIDGDAITAAVCSESDISSGARAGNKAELTALRVLDQLEKSGPVREREWLRACAAGDGVSGSAQPASRLRMARRVIQRLKEQGLVDALDGIVTGYHASL